MQLTNIAVRLAGIAMFAIPAGVFAFELTHDVVSPQGMQYTPVIGVSFLAVPGFGIQGLVIGTKGPLHGDVTHANRRIAVKAVFTLVLLTLPLLLMTSIIWSMDDLLSPRHQVSRWDALAAHLYSHSLVSAAFWTDLIAVGLASAHSPKSVSG